MYNGDRMKAYWSQLVGITEGLKQLSRRIRDLDADGTMENAVKDLQEVSLKLGVITDMMYAESGNPSGAFAPPQVGARPPGPFFQEQEENQGPNHVPMGAFRLGSPPSPSEDVPEDELINGMTDGEKVHEVVRSFSLAEALAQGR